MTRHDRRVSAYLQALSQLCAEVADQPRLLPTFLRILTLVPPTIVELLGEARGRIAA